VFHLVTHAFFKACLFLGSGSVIHAMGGEQDIRKMGGLKAKIPITFRTFQIATFAIAGFPLAAGFFSKDEILASAFSTPYFPAAGKLVWFLGSVAALCTSFYMYRMYYLVFYGKFRGTDEQEHHLHESPKSMTIPLIVLALLSALGGLLGLPEHIIHVPHLLGRWLHSIFPEIPGVPPGEFLIPVPTEILVMVISTLLALTGWYFAKKLYKDKSFEADERFQARMPVVARLLENKYFVDEAYAAGIVRPINRASVFLWKIIDAIIDGSISFLGFLAAAIGDILRFLQTGNVRNYALMMFLGVIVFVWMYV